MPIYPSDGKLNDKLLIYFWVLRILIKITYSLVRSCIALYLSHTY
jgi:hypothetical protein